MIRRFLLIAAISLTALPALAQEDAVRGPVRPQRLASLGPQNDGVVREVAVAEGAAVRQGDVLLRLDDAVQAARIGLARAAGRGAAADRFEKQGADYHGQVRAAFLARAAADPRRCVVVAAGARGEAAMEASAAPLGVGVEAEE